MPTLVRVNEGAIAQLDDGRSYRLAPIKFTEKIATWQIGDEIEVSPQQHPVFPLRLTNIQDGTSIAASPHVGLSR